MGFGTPTVGAKATSNLLPCDYSCYYFRSICPLSEPAQTLTILLDRIGPLKTRDIPALTKPGLPLTNEAYNPSSSARAFQRIKSLPNSDPKKSSNLSISQREDFLMAGQFSIFKYVKLEGRNMARGRFGWKFHGAN